MSTPRSSLTSAYADRLESRAASRWRKYLGVQLPYRWNLRRLRLGFVLDVGCGVGRNLAHLDGNGVGVDPNIVMASLKATLVAVLRLMRREGRAL